MSDFPKILSQLRRFHVVAGLFALWILFESLQNLRGPAADDLANGEAQADSDLLGEIQGSAEDLALGLSDGGTPASPVQPKEARAPVQFEIRDLRNPFLEPGTRGGEADGDMPLLALAPRGAGLADSAALLLRGIAIGKDKGIAIVNNRPLSVGDRYREFEVVEISNDFVLLRSQDRVVRLSKELHEQPTR